MAEPTNNPSNPWRSAGGHPQRRSLCVWLTALIIFGAVQFALSAGAPLALVHQHRVPYDIVKDDLRNVDLAMATVKNYIQRHAIKEFVIILGDSVGYSGPGGPEQAVSRYLGDLASAAGGPAVFNFSLPGAQAGDIYVLMLKLQQHGLNPDWLIINLLYAGFVARVPDPPPVFWLRDELARLDPAADLVTAPAYPAEERTETAAERVEAAIIEWGQRYIPTLAYRDYLRAALLGPAMTYAQAEGSMPTPWYEKPWLDSYLRQAEYLRSYDPAPLVMDDSNPNVFFLYRIAARAAPHTRVLFFNSPVNPALLADLQRTDGYQANLRAIDHLMLYLDQSYAGVDYVNYTRSIDDRLFVDHLHLTPEGYAQLAAMIWAEIETAR